MNFSHRIELLFVACGLAFCITGCRTSQPKVDNPYTGLMSGRGNVPPAYAEVGPIPRSTASQSAVPSAYNEIGSDNAFVAAAPTMVGDVAVEDGVVADDGVIGGIEEVEVVETAAPANTGLRQLPAVPETPAIAAGEVYTVKNGDSLSKIAVAYGVKTTDIMALNPSITSADKIKVGQKITLPSGAKLKSGSSKATGSKSASGKKSSVAKESIPADGKYSVRSGDCLDIISKRFGVKIDDIRRWSNLSSDKLQVGQQLMLKGTAAAPAAAPVAAPAVEAPVEAAAPVVEASAPVVVEDAGVSAVAAAPVTEAAPQSSVFEISVGEGDTLERIAATYETTVQAILQVNPQIQSNADLRPDMKLNIILNQQ